MKIILKVVVLAVALGIVGCGGRDETGPAEGETREMASGPHGGRLLSEGSFQLEVTIFERGVPPQFRAYPFSDSKAIDPANISLTIELQRFGGRKDVIGFAAQEDYLVGDRVVDEPHSFDVVVSAQYEGKPYRWQYESYEGRTVVSDEAAKSSGIVVEHAGGATIREVIRVFGHIGVNEDRLTEVAPRFPGLVREARKRLGERVTEGEVLAIVESNESLQQYEVRSAVAGTVIRKNVTKGEFATEGESIYTVADLGVVWVDLNIPRRDFEKLRVGQAVTISSGEGMSGEPGRISYISPFGALDTQTMLARVELPNRGGRWRPGFFVVGEITIDESSVPLAVRTEALQTFRDWNVVFMRDGDVFEIAILELGRRDSEWAEVVSGLSPGQLYVTENSFIIKADIGKSGASHDH